LETIEEIDEQNREIYLAAGGERYRYVPALNDHPDHVAMLAALARRHFAGWTAAEPAAARPAVAAVATLIKQHSS
jgi:protoporphyrin/coproporphyrin ferrochelatase